MRRTIVFIIFQLLARDVFGPLGCHAKGGGGGGGNQITTSTELILELRPVLSELQGEQNVFFIAGCRDFLSNHLFASSPLHLVDVGVQVMGQVFLDKSESMSPHQSSVVIDLVVTAKTKRDGQDMMNPAGLHYELRTLFEANGRELVARLADSGIPNISGISTIHTLALSEHPSLSRSQIHAVESTSTTTDDPLPLVGQENAVAGVWIIVSVSVICVAVLVVLLFGLPALRKRELSFLQWTTDALIPDVADQEKYPSHDDLDVEQQGQHSTRMYSTPISWHYALYADDNDAIEDGTADSSSDIRHDDLAYDESGDSLESVDIFSDAVADEQGYDTDEMSKRLTPSPTARSFSTKANHFWVQMPQDGSESDGGLSSVSGSSSSSSSSIDDDDDDNRRDHDDEIPSVVEAKNRNKSAAFGTTGMVNLATQGVEWLSKQPVFNCDVVGDNNCNAVSDNNCNVVSDDRSQTESTQDDKPRIIDAAHMGPTVSGLETGFTEDDSSTEDDSLSLLGRYNQWKAKPDPQGTVADAPTYDLR